MLSNGKSHKASGSAFLSTVATVQTLSVTDLEAQDCPGCQPSSLIHDSTPCRSEAAVGHGPPRRVPHAAKGFHAQPQKIWLNDKLEDVWPEHWGITTLQLRVFLNECQRDLKWKNSNTLRDLVDDFVKPKTAGGGVGYALKVNEASPKEVDIMVSHSWNENALEFVEALERSVSETDVLFICAFSIFQNEDGSGPTVSEQIGFDGHESPFFRVLQHISIRGKASGWRWWPRPFRWMLPRMWLIVAILTVWLQAMLFGGLNSPWGTFVWHNQSWKYIDKHWQHVFLWYCMVVSICAAAVCWYLVARADFFYVGRMIAVPNREDDLYSRLWCVYEIFVARECGVYIELAHTLAHAGSCKCQDAVCSNMADAKTIRSTLEEYGQRAYRDPAAGYRCVDRAIRLTMRGSWAVFLTAWSETLALVYLLISCPSSAAPTAGVSNLPYTYSFVLFRCGINIPWAICGWLVLKKLQGSFTTRAVIIVVGAHLLACTLLSFVACPLDAPHEVFRAYEKCDQDDIDGQLYSSILSEMAWKAFMVVMFFTVMFLSLPFRWLSSRAQSILSSCLVAVITVTVTTTTSEFSFVNRLTLDAIYPSILTVVWVILKGPVLFTYAWHMVSKWGVKWKPSFTESPIERIRSPNVGCQYSIST